MGNISEILSKVEAYDEKIGKMVLDKIKDHEIVKDTLKKLNDGKYDYLSSNDMNGVDHRVEIDKNRLLLSLGETRDLTKYLDKALEDIFSDYYYNESESEIVVSSCDEIFLFTHSETILVPGGLRDDKYTCDFHAWLIVESYMLANGYYPGVYSSNYHGFVDVYKFDKNYNESFPQDEKERKDKIDFYLSLFKFQNDLSDRTLCLEDLPHEIYDNYLPQDIRDKSTQEDIELLRLEDITEESCNLVVYLSETEEERDIKITLIPSSVRFIKEAV